MVFAGPVIDYTDQTARSLHGDRMTQAPDLPTCATLLTTLLIVSGAAITLVGSLGLLRLKTFYERVHAPTLGATMGVGFIVLASIVGFSVLQSRLVMHVILTAIFVTVTTPVTLMLLAQAALYRDRIEGEEEGPPAYELCP